jgi:ATP-dependent DNA ligase
MPLSRLREPFDDPEWIFELKYDGFRELAFVNGGGTKLVSRRGLEYRRFEDLRSEISLELNADDAVLDGEIVKLDSEERPIFIDLMRRADRSRLPPSIVWRWVVSTFAGPRRIAGRGDDQSDTRLTRAHLD